MNEKKKRKSIFLSILKWFGYGLLFLILFIILSLFAINEIKFLRKPVLQFATNIANNALLAEISLGDIKFTSFNSVEITDACMIADGDTFANIGKINAEIEIPPIFQSKFYVNNLQIQNGTVKLLRNLYDSSWNFEKIVPPSESVSEPSATQPIIDVRKLNLSNISLRLKDSTVNDTSGKFNPLDIFAQNLNIDLSAYVNLNTNKIRGNIKNISFNEQINKFNLSSLSVLFQMDSSSINIDKLNLITDNSSLNIVAKLNEFSPLSKENYTDIEKAIFDVNADIDSINTNDLLKFTVLPFNNNQVAHIKLVANGTNSELVIQQLNANIGNTHIDLTGSLFNFMNDSITYSANIENSIVAKQDLINLINEDLSVIPNDVNYAEIKEIQANGSSKHINANLDLITDAGAVIGIVNFQFEPDYKYLADLEFRKLDLEKITSIPDLASNLNGNIFLEGSGLDIKDMDDTLFVTAYNSMIYRDSIDTMIVRGSLNRGIAEFPEIKVKFPEPRNSFVKLNVSTDFRNLKKPTYAIKGRLNNVNLAAVAHDQNMPVNFTDNFELVGSGIDLDSIEFQFTTEIEELYLKNLALMPQKLDIILKNYQGNERELSLLSGQNQINARGEIKIDEFVSSLSQHMKFASSYFESFYNNIILKKQDSTLERVLTEEFRDYKFPFFDLNVEMNLKDFALVSVFIPDLNIVSSINSNIKITSFDSNFVIYASPMDIGFTSISTNGTKIQVDPFNINGFARIEKDSNQLTIPQVDVSIKNIDALKINQTQIINPDLSMNLKYDKVNLSLSGNYDTLVQIRTNLSGNIEQDYMNLRFDTLQLSAFNRYNWRNSRPLLINLDATSIDIRDWELISESSETISIRGRIDTTGFDSMAIDINNLNIRDYSVLLSTDLYENLKNLKYKNLYINFNANGELNNPDYTLKFGIDSIIYENSHLGNIVSDFVYLDKKLDGKIEIGDNQSRVNIPLNIEVSEFPIDLSMENFGKIYDDYSLNITMDSLQAGYLGLFLPMVSDLSGVINSKIHLFGDQKNEISLTGNLDINDVRFNLKLNNINYKLNSQINFENNLIKVDKLSLKNEQYSGSLDVNGEVILSRNNLEYFNFDVIMKNFIILDESSKFSNLGIYGKVDISTRNGSVSVIGDLKSQEIQGALQINKSDITIVNLSQSNSRAKASFIYEIKGDTKVYTYKIQNDTTQKDTSAISPPRRLNSEKLNIDLSVYIPQKINATLQLGAIGEIDAIIGTSDPTVPLRFVINPQNPSGQLYGELILEEGSTIKSYKEMKASGSISFQTGNLSNPSLNITGEYEGKIDDPQNPGKYITYIRITGTAQSPIVNFDYTINNAVPQGDSTTIQGNALYLLLFGYIPGSSMNTGGGLLDPSIVSDIGNMGLSSVASRSFSDLLTKTGVIESADIQLNSQDFEQTRIQLKGKLMGNVNWSLSGNLSDFSRNNQIIIEIPISVNSSALNQLIGQIAYSTNTNSTTIDPNEKNWEIKLKFGGSW